MPTIEITSTAKTVPQRRAIAVRLTRWLVTRGVNAGNVVVRFFDHQPGSVFSGGMQIEALSREPGDEARLRHASVICCVGPDRDDEFRRELAEELAAALGMTAETRFLYIEFRPTSPSHAHFAVDGALVRADRAASTTLRGTAS